jgi:hypothetical protein
MVKPAVYVYDPDTGEWVTPEEYMRRQRERETTRRKVRDTVSSLLQGAVIQFTLTGHVCGTNVTLTGTGAVVALGTDVMTLIETFGRPGAAGGLAHAPGPGGGGPGGAGRP